MAIRFPLLAARFVAVEMVSSIHQPSCKMKTSASNRPQTLLDRAEHQCYTGDVEMANYGVIL
jgi:hypothetical protein